MKLLITGAAGGIGSAAVRAAEAAGHDVIRHDVRDADGIDVVGNLLDPAALARIADACADAGVDGVIATHGMAGAGELETIDAETALRIMRVNTTSVLRLHDALRAQLERTRGVFVAVSSQAGLVGEAQNGVYSASKFALVGWARAVAASDPSVRLRVVCPGMIETPLLVAAFEGMAADLGTSYADVLARRLASVPAGRLGSPAEIGQATVWLAGLQTAGCVIAPVTGGEVLR